MSKSEVIPAMATLSHSETDATIIEALENDLSEDLNHLVLSETSNQEIANLNDFKFNFVISYDQRVEESLYPKSFIRGARKYDNVSEYTVQQCGVGWGNCLLCPCNLVSIGRNSKLTWLAITRHVRCKRHLKFASNKANTSALRQYHEFWRAQEPKFQAHQVHFVPEVLLQNDLVTCQLCQEYLEYCSVVKHIKDGRHKNKVLKIFYSPEGKWNKFYLMDMQLEVYDIVANHTWPKKEEKKDGNPQGQPKCVFVKFVIGPSGLKLPPRYQDHDKFFSVNLDLVTCQICSISFKNNVTDIRKHIINPQHKQLSGVLIPKYSFFCEICNVPIKDEDAWEKHFSKGPNRHHSMSQDMKLKVAEYECRSCMVVLFGDELSLSRQISVRSGKTRKHRGGKLPSSVKKMFKTEAFIEDEAFKLRCEATLVLRDRKKMKLCCEDLENALGALFPGCKAYAFGSRISGLGNNKSDLDVFMDTGNMYLGGINQELANQEQLVKKASELLKSVEDKFSHVVAIPSARTPIVKLYHFLSDLDCDVSFRHGLGVENTKFLSFCIQLQPVTQPFILFLKNWSRYCRLDKHITNYGLAWMAIFFLQTRGYLLSVNTVRNYNSTESLIIDGWETLNYTVPVEKMRNFVTPYDGTVKVLLRDFFNYFSKFDYANNVVCPLLGNTILKMLFNEKPTESLPVEMKSYVQRIQSENGGQFRGLTPFCVQDPFDLSHNLTKACQHGTINKLKALCSLTSELLDKVE